MQSFDGVERFCPNFKVNVWWRSGGQDVGVPIHRNARGVSDIGSSVAGIQEGDVMRSVPGCVEHRQLARAKRNGFATFEDAEIFLRNGEEITVEALHLIAIE